MRPAAALLCASPLVFACSRTYHPEYHPETSYTYVSAAPATYVQNAAHGPEPARPAPAEAPIPCIRALERCPPQAEVSPQADLSAAGGIVINGNFTGNIYVAR